MNLLTALWRFPFRASRASVTPGSGADKAGIKRPCGLPALTGKTITQIQELTELLQYYPAGETAEITVKIPATGGTYTENLIRYARGGGKQHNTPNGIRGGKKTKIIQFTNICFLTLRRIAISAEMCVRAGVFPLHHLLSMFRFPSSIFIHAVPPSRIFHAKMYGLPSPIPKLVFGIQYLPVGRRAPPEIQNRPDPAPVRSWGRE